MPKTPLLPGTDDSVRVLRRRARRQVRRAGRDRRLALGALATMVAGVALLVLAAMWPLLAPAPTKASGRSTKLIGPAPSVPPVSTILPQGSATLPTVPGSAAPGVDPTSAPTVTGGGDTSTPAAPVAPASTIALPAYAPPSLPPVTLPPTRPLEQPIVVAVDYGVNNGNPHLTTGVPNDNQAVLSEVLPQPFRAGARGEPVLDQNLIAEPPKVDLVAAAPRMLVVYKIRPDANWSDGEPIVCDDFRLDRIARSGRFVDSNGTSLFNTAAVPAYGKMGVDCTDNGKTVTMLFDEAEPDWRWLFDGLLPSHVVKQRAGVADLTSPDGAAAQKLAKVWNQAFALRAGQPLPALPSAGPFANGAVTDSGVSLVPNESFLGTRPQNPAGFTVVAAGQGKRFDLVAQGQAQLANLPADSALIGAIRQGSGGTIVEGAPVSVEELVVNLRSAVLQRKSIRQALAACIDQTSLVASRVNPAIPSAVATTNRIVRPFEPGYRSVKDPTLTGVDKARELLANAGFTLGRSGFAELPAAGGNILLTLRIAYEKGSLRAGVVDAIVQQCRPAGFNLVPVAVAGPLVSEVAAGGDWDLAVRSSPNVLSVAGRVGRYREGAANVGSYVNPKVSELADAAARELDPDRQTALWNEVDAQLWADVASIPLYTLPDMVVAANSVAGVGGGAGAASLFATALAWH